MQQMVLIGLTGYKGHGKSSVANILEAEYGFHRLSFGKALKETVDRIDPMLKMINNEHPVYLSELRRAYTEDEIKEYYPEYRRFLQRFGTEGIRHLDPDLWVKKVVQEIKSKQLHAGVSRFVIDDVRFPNESQFVRQNKGSRLLRVDRPGADFDDSHASESFVGKLNEDATITNMGSLDDLRTQVSKIVGVLLPELHLV